MPRVAKTIGFSVSQDVIDDVERMAAAEGRSRSELFREMVRVYKRDRELAAFEDLAAYGRERARVRAVRSEDDVECLIHEARGV